MRPPAVSVIVPTFNDGQFLNACLESVLAQTFTDWEILVVDDASTDNSVEVARTFAEQHPDKIRVFRVDDGPGGIPRAINAGLREMRGSYFSWLNPADRCHPLKLERLVQTLESRLDAAFVHSGYRVVDSHGQAQRVHTPAAHTGITGFIQMLRSNYVADSTILARKVAMDAVGPLLETDRTVPDLHRTANYLLFLELALKADVATLPEPLQDLRPDAARSERTNGGYTAILEPIAKRQFLKKHGFPRIVSLLCRRSRLTRGELYQMLTGVLLQDNYPEDIMLLSYALSRETAAEISCIGEFLDAFQRERNEPRVIDHYLSTDAPVSDAVLSSFRKPSERLETLAQRILVRGKTEFREGRLAEAERLFASVQRITRFFPSLDAGAKFYQAMCLSQLGQWNQATERYRAVLELDPSHAEARDALTAIGDSATCSPQLTVFPAHTNQDPFSQTLPS